LSQRALQERKEQYIKALETDLKGIRDDHISLQRLFQELEGAWIARSPVLDIGSPYLPPDIVVANDDTQVPLHPPSPTEKQFTSPSILTVQPKNGADGDPRWKRIVDQMTKGWDRPTSWIDKRATIGLNSVEMNRNALTLILGLRDRLPLTWHDHAQPLSPGGGSTSDALIMTARQYALDTKASQMSTGFVVQVYIFRELVFASLCVVMEQQGLPIDTINDLMRICMSSSGPANLYRLRRGALWVNRVISGTMMKKMGWSHGSTEFFLLCKRSLSYIEHI
jgi:hypothetical protein